MNGSRTESVVDCDTVRSAAVHSAALPCSQISVPHRSRRPLLASRMSVGGFVAVQAYKGRLCLECSTGYYPFFGNCLECENKLGARLLQTPAASLPRLPAKRKGRVRVVALARTYTRIHAHSIERARRSSLCAACVPVCVVLFAKVSTKRTLFACSSFTLACGSSGCWSTGSCATNFRRWTRTPDACLGRLYAVVPSQFIGLCFQDIPLPLAHLDFSHPGRALWWNDHLTVLPHSYLNFAQIAGALGEVRKSPSVGC